MRSRWVGSGTTGVGAGLFSGNRSFVAGGGGVGTGTCWGSGNRSGGSCTEGLGEADGLPYAVAYGFGGGNIFAGDIFGLGEGDCVGLGVGVLWVCANPVKENAVIAVIADNAANAITAVRSKKLVNPLPIMKSRSDKTNRERTPSNANQACTVSTADGRRSTQIKAFQSATICG
jgi:hypothetical protein